MADTIFYLPDISVSPILPEQESAHCVKVLRMTTGDSFTATDGKGYFYDCVLINADKKKCAVRIDKTIEAHRSFEYSLHIAFAPTKNIDRTEWLLEKLTEIGVSRITPISCRYSERKQIKSERLLKIAVSAIKQSKQAFLPILDEMIPFDQFMQEVTCASKFIAHCDEGEKKSLANVYKRQEDSLILIGPEGDFSREEIERAIQLNFLPISLAGNRLRTETAAIVACQTIHTVNEIDSRNFNLNQ